MPLIELAVGLVATSVFLVARARQPRRLLLSDGVYLGLFMFFVGAWLGAVEMHWVPGARPVLFLATLSLVSASAAGCLLGPLAGATPPATAPVERIDPRLVYAIGGFIVLFTAAFSVVVYKVLLRGNLSVLTTDNGLLAIRKLISTGERGYFYPGLVKQVRDILAPAFVFLLVAYTPRGRYRVLIAVVSASTLASMLLGGQRMPLLVFGWAVVMAYRVAGGSRAAARTRSWLRAAACLVVTLVVLGEINVLLGRSDAHGNAFAAMGDTVQGAFERIVLAVPYACIESYQFLSVKDIGLGQLWLADLAVLLPGTSSGLSNELHSYLGGSLAGNAVLGQPVSAYLNAGYAGVVLSAMAAMFAAALLDAWALRMRSPLVSSARWVLLAYAPLCYDPYMFLLYGGLFLFFCMGLVTCLPLATRRRRWA